MATNNEVYTDGGAPSNGQVASVKVRTVDISKLNEGVGTGIADVINLFDLDVGDQVISGGYEVSTACAATVTLDIGIDGGAEIAAGVVASAIVAPTAATALPALGDAGSKITVEVNVAASTTGVIKVWLCVANFLDPAEEVPAYVRIPPIIAE